MFEHEVAQDGEQRELPVESEREVVVEVFRNAFRVVVAEGFDQAFEFAGAVGADLFGFRCIDRSGRLRFRS